MHIVGKGLLGAVIKTVPVAQLVSALEKLAQLEILM